MPPITPKTIDAFFREELQALQELGKKYAQIHPDRARLLNPDALPEQDPYVERLFEGFAFLSGRIREKIDGSLAEFVASFVDLLWPFYSREIPSLTVVQFKNKPLKWIKPLAIPRQTLVQSGRVGVERAVCTFSTTQKVMIAPLQIDNVETGDIGMGKSFLKFRFSMVKATAGVVRQLSTLRLYLHAEMPTAMMLHEYLTRRVVAVSIEGRSGKSITLDALTAVLPAGFAANETLLPDEEGHFTGHSLLREYFIFPEKFLFIDLHGFDLLSDDLCTMEGEFSYCLHFDKRFPPNLPFGTEAFRLFCAPAINLFECDIEPVSHTGLRTEYLLTADAAYRESVNIQSIRSVTGLNSATGVEAAYYPAQAFRSTGKEQGPTYAVHFRTDRKGRRKCFLEPGGSQLSQAMLQEELLSICGFCCNGMLPREEIRENGITNIPSDIKAMVRVSNITRPGETHLPPQSEDFLGIYLVHQASAYATLADASALKALLRLYDWSGDEGRKRRIEAIAGVTAQPAQKMVDGAIVKGVEITISIEESVFGDVSDMHLFGMVLQRFFTLNVSINTYADLALITRPAGTVHWFRHEIERPVR
jgi:type VI secretion system protein ImpG